MALILQSIEPCPACCRRNFSQKSGVHALKGKRWHVVVLVFMGRRGAQSSFGDLRWYVLAYWGRRPGLLEWIGNSFFLLGSYDVVHSEIFHFVFIWSEVLLSMGMIVVIDMSCPLFRSDRTRSKVELGTVK